MANALVLRRGTNLEKRNRALRAVQYVRVSTELQRYSTQNQAASIAVFAEQNGLTIVRTYVDEGRSGLRINRRPGLQELLDDVNSGQADFDHILVYDVSRWGRFQDVDESAHYEFLCKQQGIRVVYCAEQFANDGSLLSSIVKNIKRVMAAEYSRELGVKVLMGQCRTASLGFRVGGPVGYGLRRELIDESKRSRGYLSKGERKALKTDRVLLRLGSEDEAEVVRWIFHQFVNEKLSYTEIARQLTRNKVPGPREGKPWTDNNICTILQNEAYIGNLVYNRTSRRLGQTLVRNPDDKWVRCENLLEPIIDKSLFSRAQKLMAERRIEIPEDQMLTRLRILLARTGRLSSRIIDDAPGVPCAAAYVNHFGSLRKAYTRIGHATKRDCDWLDTRSHWEGVLTDHASRVVIGLQKRMPASSGIEACGASVRINGKVRLSFIAARHAKREIDRVAHWRIYRRKKLSGLLVVLRLDEANKDVFDYVVMPASEMTGPYLWTSENYLPRNAQRVTTVTKLSNAIHKRLSC